MTWDELVAIEADLRPYELDAEQAGRNHCDWWLSWVRTFGAFVNIVRALEAEHPGARSIVLKHLEDVFRRAGGRPSTSRSAKSAVGRSQTAQ